jgi:hypothetical protein
MPVWRGRTKGRVQPLRYVSYDDSSFSLLTSTSQSSGNTFDNLPYLANPTCFARDDELARYLAAACVVVTDPIKWWLENQSLYPRLSQMAINYLTIPGL